MSDTRCARQQHRRQCPGLYPRPHLGGTRQQCARQPHLWPRFCCNSRCSWAAAVVSPANMSAQTAIGSGRSPTAAFRHHCRSWDRTAYLPAHWLKTWSAVREKLRLGYPTARVPRCWLPRISCRRAFQAAAVLLLASSAGVRRQGGLEGARAGRVVRCVPDLAIVPVRKRLIPSPPNAQRAIPPQVIDNNVYYSNIQQ